MGIRSPLSALRKRWKYMDSNLRTLIVWVGGLVVVSVILLMASSLFFGPEPIETEQPGLSTDVDCTGDGACTFEVAVNSTGSADDVAVAYEPVGANTSSTIGLGAGEAATFDSRATVTVYARSGNSSRLHSTYGPTPVAGENASRPNAPNAAVTYDHTANGGGEGSNVTVTLTAVDGAESVTVQGEDQSRTLTTGESLEFDGRTSETSVTIATEHEGADVVVQEYTLMAATSSRGGPGGLG